MTALEERFRRRPSHPQFLSSDFSFYGQIVPRLESNSFGFFFNVKMQGEGDSSYLHFRAKTLMGRERI